MTGSVWIIEFRRTKSNVGDWHIADVLPMLSEQLANDTLKMNETTFPQREYRLVECRRVQP
jgi:hypothetical protein